ncbi:oligopeptide/dipeptide ABC transporter ATP-binding protein [Aminobacter niigataensis]|uniref:Oligopeptide/dipeptide ABC transporter ATP-binding protein n=1 Tax=Aminobacter niigataensis TaxID=83265 RepID=A0ABR6L980_9HYPH|nr:ABC transporter ATP-binding protein [Aminobacter niigataensis]MBB4653362.1 oligopeptide/dipeptide ABC transporter ATP-binding protein [Aminobacter niigataensis]
MTALLEVNDMAMTFPLAGSKKVQAVNGVSFTLDKGETLSLVGESGSGKTTIGRCVLGLIEATGGTVTFAGERMGGRRTIRSPSLRGRLQLVFQEPAESLDPRVRIGRTIAEPLVGLKLSRADRDKRVFEIIRRVGLSESVLDLFPAELSAGQQQRVGIGRAIVTRPELIVLDEPTSALDPTARAEIIDLLIRLQGELETAYLFISHDLSTVRYLSHRVAVLYLGMVVEEGFADELFAKPRHPYSIGLLSSVLLPDPKLKGKPKIELKGEIPSPIDLPRGCFLASRCPFADDHTRSNMPPVSIVDRGHMVRCFKHKQIAEMDYTSDTFSAFQAETERLLSEGVENN